MQQYNPDIHKRKSIRLKGYDYSQAGLYFVTICCQNREHFFGEISKGEMQLNEAGKMIEKWYFKLENKFPDIKCHEMVVMPNHFHCIIENVGIVGADPRVCPNSRPNSPIATGNKTNPNIATGNNNTPPQSMPNENKHSFSNENKHSFSNENKHSFISGEHVGSTILGEHVGSTILGEHVGSPLHTVVQWFKTMTTNEYIRGVKNLGWKRFDKKLWQRNYYEHIIRNEKSFIIISNYIRNNPLQWQMDKFYKSMK